MKAATSKLSPAERRQRVQLAIAFLKEARKCLRQSGATQSAAKVGRALKSAEGAYRHAVNRQVLAAIAESDNFPAQQSNVQGGAQ